MENIDNNPNIDAAEAPNRRICLQDRIEADTALVPCSLIVDLINKAVGLIGTIDKVSVGLVAEDVPIGKSVRLPKGFLIHALTSRELAVLQLMAHGLNNSAIAEQLTITKKSVENYINRIYQSLNLTHESNIYPRVLAVIDYKEYVMSGQTNHYKSFPEYTDQSPIQTSPMSSRFDRAA